MGKGSLVTVLALVALCSICCLPQESNDSTRMVDRTLDLAFLYIKANRLAEARATFGEAERMARAINYRQGLADALYGLGDCARWRHDNADAVPYYKEAQALYRELDGYYYYARLTSDLGNCYEELGFIEMAVACWYQSLDVFQQVLGVDGHEYEIGVLHNNLGKSYLNFSKNLDQAQAHYYAAFELFQKIDHTLGKGNTLIGLGGVREYFGRYREAIDHYEQALTCYEQLDDVIKTADTYVRIGGCYIELGQHQSALQEFQKALEVYRELQNELRCTSLLLYPFMNPSGAHLCLVSKDGECCALQGMCQANIGLGDLGAASACARTALSYAEGLRTLYQTLFPLEMDAVIRLKGLKAWSFYQLASCSFAEQDYESALERYKQAAAESGPTVSFLRGQARCLRALGKLDQALNVYKTAVEIIEEVRGGGTTLEIFRIGCQRLGQACYQEMLDIMAGEANSRDGILLYAERARSRSLLDALQYGGQHRVSEVEGLTLECAVSVQEIQTLIDSAASCLRPSEAALVYAWGVDHLFTWVVTKGQRIEGPLVQPINYDQFLEEVYEFRSLLEALDIDEDAVERALQLDEVQTRLRGFYNVLIAPVEQKIVDKETLIIIPSGPLWYVPFAALRTADEGTSYLIESFAIAYAPSLASLPTLLAPKEVEPTASLLALANPKREDMPPLPHLVDAARAFSEAVGGNTPYFEKQATEALLNQEIPPLLDTDAEGIEESEKRYRYVLLACHGKFNHTNPLYSYLALVPGQEEDGDFYAREVLGFDLNGTKLVLLMACETFLTAIESRVGIVTAGLGSDLPPERKLDILRDLVRGDELVGLSRAFLLAGAEAVLATHWEVQVGAASQLTSVLGEGLASDLPKAQALQAAQLKLIDAGQTDPWLWGPFLLIGDWR